MGTPQSGNEKGYMVPRRVPGTLPHNTHAHSTDSEHTLKPATNHTSAHRCVRQPPAQALAHGSWAILQRGPPTSFSTGIPGKQ